MKTNQNLIRKMGDFEVVQRTKDGMFNGTLLLKQWNSVEGNADLRIEKFLNQAKTKQFIDELVRNIQCDNQPIPENQVIKRSNARTTSNGKRIAGEVWMHPYIFIDFAMWLNPAFKVKVLKFVYDELIKYRNEAGDAYREMSVAIGSIVSKTFMPQAMSKTAKAINVIVYGEHESEIRNKQASEEKARELMDLEKKITMLINDGYIKSFEGLMNQLRKDWKRKHTPKELIA